MEIYAQSGQIALFGHSVIAKITEVLGRSIVKVP